MKKENKKYKVLIFDLDGTLIDSMPYHFKAFKETLKEHGVDMKDATLKNFMGGSTKDILVAIKKVYDFDGNIEDVREERRYHYFQVLGKKNILFPGVRETLNSLAKKYKLAIATGSSRVTARYSVDKNFQRLFSSIVTINDVKKGKPAPDQLYLVCKKLNVNPSECLFVGDSVYDILAAKNAKIDSLGVLTGYTPRKKLLDAGAGKILGSVRHIKNYLNEN